MTEKPRLPQGYSHQEETLKLIDLLVADGLTEMADTLQLVLKHMEANPDALSELKPAILSVLHSREVNDLHVTGQAKKVLKRLTLNEMV